MEKGLITEEDINRSIRNSFRTRIRLGWFDGEGDCPYTNMGEEYINNEEHKAITAKMAEESVVLLKNERQILPFLPEETESIAVVGNMAAVWYKDWYCGILPYHVTVLDGMRQAYPDTEITYDSGLSEICLTCNGKYVGLDKDNRLFLTDKSQAEVFRFTDWGCGNTTLVSTSNGMFVTLEEGSYLIKADKKEAFSWFIRESFRFRDSMTDSVDVRTDKEETLYYIDSWNGRKITVDADGYLAVIKDGEPHVGEGDDAKLNRKCHAVSEGEAVQFGTEVVRDGMAQAVELAKKAQKVVVVLGSNPVINSKEEIDRTTLALPPAQQRLAMTWYRSDVDLPDINDYDIIQGKRTYQYYEVEVLYSFGHGLSYAEFQYHPLVVEADEECVTVRLSIENIGKVTADEVVQLYVHKETSRVKQPLKQLRGFERVKGVQPGESPDNVDRAEAEKEKVVGQLEYDDVVFTKKPEKILVQVHGLESGGLHFICQKGTEVALEVTTRVKKADAFEQIEVELPENSADLEKKYTLLLAIHGKIKVNDYIFL